MTPPRWAALNRAAAGGLLLAALAAASARAQHTTPPKAPASPATPAPAPPPDVSAPDLAHGRSPVMAEQFADSVQKFADSMQMFGDSMSRFGDSMGRAGRQFGDRMRARFGPRFRDSLRAAVRQLVQQSATARAAGIAHARQAEADAKHGDKRGIATLIDRVRHDPQAIPLPPADSFAVGDLKIITDAAGTTGTVATVNGDLTVMGTINGNAIAIGGNVILHPGSHVTGSVLAAGGDVQFVGTGAIVDGEIRSLKGPIGPAPVVAATAAASGSTRAHDIKLAVSAVVLLFLLGMGVLTFAEEQLDDVTATLADRFGRSLWYGAVGQVALLPVLLALIIGLAITVVGILALPFAIVGYMALAAGVATLGFMAVAEAAGTAVLRHGSQDALTPRGAQLRAIFTGLGMFGGLWIFTAIAGTTSGVGLALRAVVVCVTVVAVVAGFGAVLVWRYEIRRASRAVKTATPLPAAELAWQTPTPVAGVAAARRPTPPAVTTSRPSE